MDHVFIAPGLAGHSDRFVEQRLPVLEENVPAFRAGERAAKRYVVET